MSFFGLGKSHLYPRYYWDFRTNKPIGSLSGSVVSQATFSGSIQTSLTGTQVGPINTPWKYPWQNSVPSSSAGFIGTSSFAGAVSGNISIPATYIGLSQMVIPTTWTFSGWMRMNEEAEYSRAFDFNNGADNSRIVFCADSKNAGRGRQALFIYNENGGADDDRITCADFFTVGEWLHWAFSCDGSTIKAYHNGALTGSKSLTHSQVARTLPNCSIGLSPWTTDNAAPFNQMDFCIHNVALDAVSIENMYSGSVSPSAVSSSNIIQYYSLDAFESRRLGRGQDPSLRVTSSCNTAISASITGTIFLTSSTARNNMHLVPSTSVGGYLGNSVFIADGVDDSILFNSGALEPIKTVGPSFTMAAWCQRYIDSDYQRIFSFGNKTGNGQNSMEIVTGGDAFQGQDGIIFSNYNGTTFQGAYATSLIPKGEWTHIVAVSDNTATPILRLFVNGELKASAGSGHSLFSSGVTLPAQTPKYGGIIADVFSTTPTILSSLSTFDAALWNTPLDSGSIQSLYWGLARPKEISGSNLIIYYPVDEGSGNSLEQGSTTTISSSVTANIFNTDCAGYDFSSPFSGTAADANQFYSYSFNGASNYVTLPTTEWGTKWSITGWAKTTLSSSTNFARVFEFNNPGNVSFVNLTQRGVGGTLIQGNVYYADTNGANQDIIRVDDFWDVGKWVHFGLTTDGVNLNLYKNGTIMSGGVMNYSHTPMTRSLNAIGTRPTDLTERLWNGGVAELAVWDFDLTDMQMQALYNEGKYTFSNMTLEYKQTYLSGTTFVTGNVPQ
mgnify:CR=1 FL=1